MRRRCFINWLQTQEGRGLTGVILGHRLTAATANIVRWRQFPQSPVCVYAMKLAAFREQCHVVSAVD